MNEYQKNKLVERRSKALEFWKDLVYKDGKLDEESVLKELSDYQWMIHEMSILTEHLSIGKLSYPNYPARTIIGEHDAHCHDNCTDKDDHTEALAQQESLIRTEVERETLEWVWAELGKQLKNNKDMLIAPETAGEQFTKAIQARLASLDKLTQ